MSILLLILPQTAEVFNVFVFQRGQSATKRRRRRGGNQSDAYGSDDYFVVSAKWTLRSRLLNINLLNIKYNKQKMNKDMLHKGRGRVGWTGVLN